MESRDCAKDSRKDSYFYKVALVGESGVGKTHLWKQIRDERTVLQMRLIGVDFFTLDIEIDCEDVQL